MIIRNFVKKSLDNQRKIFLILLIISVSSGLLALTVQLLFGKSSVYRDTLYIEVDSSLRPSVSVYTAGMPVEIELWDGEDIKVDCVAELPLIITQEDEGRFITISQDDGFAVSIFTFDLFRYKLKVYIPKNVEYREVNVATNSGNIEIVNVPQDFEMNVTTVSGLIKER